MRIRILLIIGFLFTLSCTSERKQSQKSISTIPEQEIPQNATALFNGTSLDGWEVTNFGPQGPVRVSGGKIIINMGDGCSGINFKNNFPKLNYKVGLEARKTVGNDFFCGVTFPVNDTYCSLIVGGWGGPVVGLSTIDGLDASENVTRTLINFEKDQWYSVILQVTTSKVEAWIDDEKVVDFNYSGHELGIRPEVNLSKPFGICTWMTTAEIKNVWLQELSDSLN